MEEKGCSCNILFGKSEWKRLFRKPMQGWQDNIELNLKQVGYETYLP
jgi:hypothetical protein